jgi:hypothetical protein
MVLRTRGGRRFAVPPCSVFLIFLASLAAFGGSVVEGVSLFHHELPPQFE